jgi:hypothetical protein
MKIFTMIERNKHPSGRISNMLFGICAIGDGLVRIFSLGVLHSHFTLEYARRQAQKRFLSGAQRQAAAVRGAK